MTTMQIYSSELSKFEFDGRSKTVIVAGEGVVGIELTEAVNQDVASLVGAQASEPVAIEAGSKWTFRDERPLVESDNGGSFAFIVPAL